MIPAVYSYLFFIDEKFSKDNRSSLSVEKLSNTNGSDLPALPIFMAEKIFNPAKFYFFIAEKISHPSRYLFFIQI